MGNSGRTFASRAIAGAVLCTSTASLGLPLDPKRLASELKMTPQTVRVKLSNLGKVMVIKGTDLALSLAKKPEIGNVRTAGSSGGSLDQWMIDCKRSLIIDPMSGKSRKLPRSGVLIESISGVLSINERRFREQIVVYPQDLLSPYDSKNRGNPECVVVNHIHIEKYLESVVNGEFNSQWAREAVEAQIIAARTYALYQMKEMRKDRGRVFDVESTQKDQVYLGLDRTDSTAAKLVADTKGMIMVPKTSVNQDPIKAFYHSSCGGFTALPEKVWGAKFAGFTKRVPCPFCAGAPGFQWEHELTLNEIADKLERGLRVDQTNRKFWPKRLLDQWHRFKLTDVKPIGGNFPGRKDEASDESAGLSPSRSFSRSFSKSLVPIAQAAATQEPRVKELKFEFTAINRLGVKTAEKVIVMMDAYQARNWLDPARLKSTWFNLQRYGSVFQFRGLGSGHGVGMCQWGAKKMGEKGFTRDQILTHYYPGVKIARVW
jgi:stage II sporulation protein D